MHTQTMKETHHALQEDMEQVNSELQKFLLKQKAEYSRFHTQVKQLKDIKEELRGSIEGLSHRVTRVEEKSGVNSNDQDQVVGILKNPYQTMTSQHHQTFSSMHSVGGLGGSIKNESPRQTF